MHIAAEFLIKRVLASGLFVALYENFITCFDENDLDLDVLFGAQSLPREKDLREHISRSYINSNGDLFRRIVGHSAQIYEPRDQLWRDIVDAVIADVLKDVHNAGFSRTRHSGNYQ